MRSSHLALCLLLGTLLVACSTAPIAPQRGIPERTEAGGVTGWVSGVHDGDTLTLLTRDRRELKVRLDGIDAPELRQPFGTRSKQELGALVFHREVHVRFAGTDRYQRHLGRVFVNSQDVNLLMVQRGFAWCYRQYNKDPALVFAEEDARARRLGLWLDPHSVPPWDWRKH